MDTVFQKFKWKQKKHTHTTTTRTKEHKKNDIASVLDRVFYIIERNISLVCFLPLLCWMSMTLVYVLNAIARVAYFYIWNVLASIGWVLSQLDHTRHTHAAQWSMPWTNSRSVWAPKKKEIKIDRPNHTCVEWCNTVKYYGRLYSFAN